MKTLNHLFKICLLLLATSNLASADHIYIQQDVSSMSLQAGACFTNNITIVSSLNTNTSGAFYRYDISYSLVNTATGLSYPLTFCSSNKSLRGHFYDPATIIGVFSVNGGAMDAPASLKIPACVPTGNYDLKFSISNVQVSHTINVLYSNTSGPISPISPFLSFSPSCGTCSAGPYTQHTGINVTNNGAEAVYGTGTNNFLSKWNTGSCNTGVTNSQVYDNGTNVGIGTSSPNTKLEISGGVTRLTTNTSSFLEVGALNSASDNFAYISSGGQSNGTGLKFATATSAGSSTPAIRMIMLNNGNVGIGTNTPATTLETNGAIRMTANTTSKLQVGALNSGDNFAYITSAEQTNGSGLKFVTTDGPSSNYGLTRMTIRNDGSVFMPPVASGGNFYFGGETNSGQTGMRLWGNATGLAGGGIDVKSNLGFIIRMDNTDGSTERVRINANNGYFGINSNPTAVLHVKGTNTTPEFFLEPSSWSSSGHHATLKMGDGNHYIRSEYGVGMSFYDMNRFCFQNAPVIISGSSGNCAPETGMVFTVRGDAWSSGVKWYTSDKRYKKEIKVIENAAEKLSKISGYTYQYDTEKFPDMSFSKGTQAGILAQELKEVLPEAVRLNDKGYYSVNYNAIIPLLIEAVKEQNKKVSGKDEVINQLKSEVSSLESRLQKLEQAIVGNNNGGTEKGNLLLKDVPVLEQNTPNPFSTSTTVKYFVPNMKNSAEIDVYDSKGIRINSYAIKVAGNGEITIKTQDLAPGNYFYELVIDGQKIASRKMIFVH